MEKGMDSDDEAVILSNFKSSNAPPRGCREPLEGGDGIKGSQTARKSAPSAANSFTGLTANLRQAVRGGGGRENLQRS